MPGKARPGKIRTSSSAKKRIRRTGKDTFVHEKAAHNHLLQQKSKRQKRLASKVLKVNAYKKTLKRLLPN
ncbi:50S ribosomal protein L35 [Patescibacteria group bacterium]|nr:50S ribosomal protein L35 [Patescibacteria group bacterium]MBU1682876.1 50S ribosomal protein L35 [Patescibacteria group bacterium]